MFRTYRSIPRSIYKLCVAGLVCEDCVLFLMYDLVCEDCVLLLMYGLVCEDCVLLLMYGLVCEGCVLLLTYGRTEQRTIFTYQTSNTQFIYAPEDGPVGPKHVELSNIL